MGEVDMPIQGVPIRACHLYTFSPRVHDPRSSHDGVYTFSPLVSSRDWTKPRAYALLPRAIGADLRAAAPGGAWGPCPQACWERPRPFFGNHRRRQRSPNTGASILILARVQNYLILRVLLRQ
eukprot:1051583-Prorocentrum_minimum.AAC.5